MRLEELEELMRKQTYETLYYIGQFGKIVESNRIRDNFSIIDGLVCVDVRKSETRDAWDAVPIRELFLTRQEALKELVSFSTSKIDEWTQTLNRAKEELQAIQSQQE